MSGAWDSQPSKAEILVIFTDKAAIGKAVIAGVFLAMMPSVGAAQSMGFASGFEWLDIPVSVPAHGQCDVEVPLDEMVKFPNCKLVYSFRKDGVERPPPNLNAQFSAFYRDTDWTWLQVQPLADCTELPASELRKFFCPDPEADNAVLASDVLQDIRKWRNLLVQQHDLLIRQRETLSRVSQQLASTDQSRELDELNRLEAGLTARQKQRDLMAVVANGLSSGLLSQFDLSQASFHVVSEDAELTESANAGGQPLGTLKQGEVVLLLGGVAGSDTAYVLHAQYGLGRLAPQVMLPFDFETVAASASR